MPPEGMIMVTLDKSYPSMSCKVLHYPFILFRTYGLLTTQETAWKWGGIAITLSGLYLFTASSILFPELYTLYIMSVKLNLKNHLWILYLLRIRLWIFSPARPSDWGIPRDETLCCSVGTSSWAATNWKTVRFRDQYLGGRVFLLFLIIASINLWVCKTPLGFPFNKIKFDFTAN